MNNFNKLIKFNNSSYKFRDVVENIEKHKVLKFNNENLKEKLEKICKKSVIRMNKKKWNRRVNEFGNFAETVFYEISKEEGVICEKPCDVKGKMKHSGYPDCYLRYDDKHYYIELKTFANTSKNSTFRSFFYSPSKTSKIIHDACHILVAFETEKNSKPINVQGFHIIDMYDIDVKLKLEFNSSNKVLYKNL